ncbi:MAG: NCS2 family permease [Candidatus Zixiibacteriota bacterium]|nr:MAG: NCS2 family permease [candidate division Zixibacteria bacterium]
MSSLSGYFKFKENNTNFRTEITAGFTTFLTMAYIIFVQPAVLSQGGMDFGAVMVATCLSAALATLIMGLLANYPIALAPGMGENFFFVFTVIIAMGIGWRTALGVIFISGVLFLLLTILKVRERIIETIPESLKHAIAVGIGFFIAFIGLVNAGLVVKPAAGMLQLGDVRSKPTLLALLGLFIIVTLMIRKIRGAILWGMFATTLVGFLVGGVIYHGILSSPPSVGPTFLKLDIIGALKWELFTIIIVFLFMDVFDTIGTLIAVSEEAGFMKAGRLPRAGRALMADAVGTVFGSLAGTSTVTSYIESCAGIEEGGRTGLTSVTVGLLFLVSLFFYPLAKMVGGGYEVASGALLYPITAPALIVVGSMMTRNIVKVDFSDYTESIPAFLVMLGMPLTFSIADGLAFGFISYPILKIVSGRAKEASWLTYVLGLVFILRYALL